MINITSNVSKCLILFFIHSFWKTDWPDPIGFVPVYPWGIRKADLQCTADFHSSHLCYRRNRLQWFDKNVPLLLWLFLFFLLVLLIRLYWIFIVWAVVTIIIWLFWIKFLMHCYHYCYHQIIIISQSGLQCNLQVLVIFVLNCLCQRSWVWSWPSNVLLFVIYIPLYLAACHGKCFLSLVISIDNSISFCGLREGVINQRY